MTENQWPEAAPPTTSDQYRSAGTPGLSVEPESSQKDVAKEEAANVAGQAAGAAQNVAGTAKAEAANVASEVKTNARDLLHQAKSDLTSQAGAQQQKAAGGIRSISSQLRTMAEAPDQQGVASDLIRQAADRSQSVASWLENRDPGSLLDEVKTFARQRPGTFLLLAAGAGVLAGRLGRSLQAGAPAATSATGTTVPAQPVQSPLAAESTLAAGTGEPFYDEATINAPAYGETVYGEPARRGFAAPGSAGVPLRDPDDPYVEGEGRQL
ncbi:hypothetical protein [Arthrobacter sp. ISL-72]|uniref:hypothetical protein n=1 Tax=Arthrobacter sp. ISL-72 TaxID=2819114 RepID=UPI002034F0EE|nr:hypothetical protein [Arthrobacter sp. ISL-72]